MIKKPTKPKPTRATKRDLFAELSEGVTALAEARQAKRTLRTHTIEYKPVPRLGQVGGVRVANPNKKPN